VKRVFPAAAIIAFLLPAMLLAQDKPFELAQKLNAAGRAEALKMFPELEKRYLLGVEEEKLLLGDKIQKLTRFFFRLPLSKNVKALYYCYKLKTGFADVRKLAAENLRPYPELVAATLEELLAASDVGNLDLASAALLEFAAVGPHEDSPSSFALYWESGEDIKFCQLGKKLYGMIATAAAALQDRLGVSSEARSELKWNMLERKSRKKDRDFIEVLKKRLKNAEDSRIKSDFTLAIAFAEEDLDALFKMLLDGEAENFSRETALHYIEASDKPEVVEKLRGALSKLKNESIITPSLSALRTAAKRHQKAKKNCEMALAMLCNNKARKMVRLWALAFFAECAKPETVEKLIDVVDTIKDKALLEQALSTLRQIAQWKLSPEQRADMALAVYGKLGKQSEDWVRKFLLYHAERKLAQRLFDRARAEKDKNLKAFYESLTKEVAEKYQEMEKRAASESAVTVAPRWLHFHQDKNGQWDADGFQKNCDIRKGIYCGGEGAADYDLATTSFSLLAYLGNGHTHRVGRFKKTVKRGLDWLRGQQKGSGSFGDEEGSLSVENHAMATMAICEAYAVTRDYRFKAPGLAAVKFLVSLQEKSGGWKKGTEAKLPDVLTTAWAVLALKAAKTAGLEPPENSFEKALGFFDSRSFMYKDTRSRFKNKERLQATAAAAIAGIFCGRKRTDGRLLKKVEFLSKNLPKWDDGLGPVYWYFGTYALFQHGGEKWQEWAKAMKKALLGRQRIGGCANGSWDPVGPDAKKLGRVGATAFNTLTLEIYYRYARATKWLKAKQSDK
jgi:prenyltransferase beta subunit